MRCKECGFKMRGKNHQDGDHHQEASRGESRKTPSKKKS